MATKSASTNPEHRVIVWGILRSLSTVFAKCMSFIDGVQVINEPYQSASVFGPEGYLEMQQQQAHTDAVVSLDQACLMKVNEKEDTAGQGWDDSKCTYQWVKELLEKDYPDKKLVFCKDIVTGIRGKYDSLPRDYRHTFLIRNPVKVYASQRKLLVMDPSMPRGRSREEFDMTQFPGWQKRPGLGFREMVDLIEHLQKIGEIKSQPIIIDADDMQNHPESVVHQYCKKTGIPFNESLLTWEAGDGVVKRNWIISRSLLQGNHVELYEAAFASTRFQPAKGLPHLLPPDVVKMAEIAEPYYRKLYEMRIKP